MNWLKNKCAPERMNVVGVGSALVDILIQEDDDFLLRIGAVKGGMIYAEDSFIQKALTLTDAIPKMVPGGSACNTVVGIAKLGGSAQFIGKCGQDDLGNLLYNGLLRDQVTPKLIWSDIPTGRVLSVITPDAQRSMLTYLGASADTLPHEISATSFDQAALVHLEGYLLFNPELITSILKQAKAAGALVSLDLASYTVVEKSRTLLSDLIATYVDILIANEDEAFAFTGIPDEVRSVQAMAEQAELAVLKNGARGSLIACEHQVIEVAPKTNGLVIDTTGAGDLWASGFLYGLVQGMALDQSGELGSICGLEVCQIVGAAIPDHRWQVIHKSMEKIWPRKS